MNRHSACYVVGFLIVVVAAVRQRAEADPPRRPADFKPFRYEYTTEQLKEKFSQDQMKRATAALKEIQTVNEKGPWKPTWDSLDKHKQHVPEWFLDGKLGVMIDWGLHSVPAFGRGLNPSDGVYPDGYGGMYLGAWADHHKRFWGADFQYDDFFPLFHAERYDPDAWMQLFQEAGVRYVIPMSKHHDGIAWWDSAWTKRCFSNMGPKRDLLTPLVEAARRRGIKVSLYFPFEEYATAMLDQNGKPVVRLSAFEEGTQPLTDANRRRISGSVPVSNYYDQYMMPLIKEMIDRFDPDGLWMDGDWDASSATLRSRDLTAYLYNKSDGRKEVYVNNRLSTKDGRAHGDVAICEFGIEFDPLKSPPARPWTHCRGISTSTAYNYAEDERSFGPPARLIHMFINTISRNGNLDLMIGPDASGQIPQAVVDRLRALGGWIRVNSEAVYATRALPPYQEGEVCYTRSKDGKFAYAICKQWPGRRVALHGVRAVGGLAITMLGVKEPLTWQQTDQALDIDIPEALQDEKTRPCQHAWVLKIPLQPSQLQLPL